MVKPHNKRKKQPRKRQQPPQRDKGGGQRRSAAGLARTGAAGSTSAAAAAAVGPKIRAFRWDEPLSQAGAPRSAKATNATAAPAPVQLDPRAAALALIATMPRLAGDLATLERFLPGADEPKQLGAAALAHLRGEVPAELRERPGEVEDVAPVVDLATRKGHRLRGQLAGFAFLIAGIGFSAWIGQRMARDAEAQHWQVVSGEVTVCKSELVSRNPDRYKPLFAYHYRVGKAWFTSRRVRFAGGQGDPVKAHRVGEKVKVYVDPKEPKISVLAPGVIGWAWAQLIAGLVVAALGGLYVMVGGREREE